ncbi:unnamed protein product (macronuclear) [Paramecium tetraurelia]|uniref:THH1/TOM1/TOM3 domain-containing protein n=1 Tax=Paramecium tetraurelia TaxID=5888 RepID=A0CIV7_PARTE|nr:uncharacterized protein GSPATT00007859001 [Paramecium tetraurelia]CAK70724.1 unnamed protein product [Paramecium tetraurelia]|eukprot:XP_001438121.1 hypothetical protein (macronuclear) [Paramecium tetraurelia strain d4-2]
MQLESEDQQAFDKVSLFTVVSLSLVSFLFYQFTSKPELYGGDECIALRQCAYFLFFLYTVYVIIIGIMIQWRSSSNSRIKLYVSGILLVGFVISNIYLIIQYCKNEPCNLLRYVVFWYLILMSIMFVLFMGVMGAIIYAM